MSNSVWILAQRARFFLLSQAKDWNHNSIGQEKIRVKVLGEVAIYPCIDNPYGLNEHTRIEKVLEFNPTKGLGEIHGFTQSNRGLKP
jgi:hypothetical protein